MPREDVKVISKTDSKESAKEDGEMQATDRLVKFFEILIQIDRRHKLMIVKEVRQ